MRRLYLSVLWGLASLCVACGQEKPWLVTRLPVNSVPMSTGAGDSMTPSISRDGRVIVFSSQAGNLVEGDRNGAILDVFAYDREAGRMERVSRANDGLMTVGSSYGAAVSADGRWVAFLSEADLVGMGGGAGVANVYLRDRELQRTVLISKAWSENRAANGECQGVQLSADGRRVCFSSRASNLTTHDSLGRLNLFVVEVESGVIRNLTVPRADEAGVVYGVMEYQMSEDGTSVVFTYGGESLAGVEPKVPTMAYHWKIGDELPTRLGAPGTPKQGFTPLEALNLAVDSSGSTIVFQTPRVSPSFLESFEGGVVLHQLGNGDMRALSEGAGSVNPWGAADASAPVVSGDGRVVGFLASTVEAGGQLSPRKIHEWTPETGVRLVAGTAAGPGVRAGIVAENLAISRDGRRLAFLSREVLTGGVEPTNSLQLYVIDRGSKAIRWVNRALGGRVVGGVVGGVEGSDPSMSGDGRWLAFSSRASNLVAGDANASSDVFVYDWDADRVELVSRRASEMPAQSSSKGSRGAVRGVSQEGGVVLLETLARELVPNETWGLSQFVVQELSTGKRTLVGLSTNRETAAQAGIQQALLSGNGRFVAFVSNSRDLWPGETNGLDHAYLQDLTTGTLHLVSKRRAGASGVGGVVVELHSITMEGRFVVFRTTDMTQFVLTSSRNGYVVYDRFTGKLIALPTPTSLRMAPVLAAESGVLGIVQNAQPFLGNFDVQLIPLAGGVIDRFPAPPTGYTGFQLSANGKRCVFYVKEAVQTEILYRDIGMPAAVPLALPLELQGPLTIQSLSWDGRFALVESGGTVYRFELATGKTEAVLPENPGGLPIGQVLEHSVMDLLGEQILFRRRFPDPFPSHGGEHAMIHVRNMATKAVSVLRPGVGEAVPGDYSARPLMSASGRLAAFTSWVDDLSGGDYNGVSDVFAVELRAGTNAGVDADGDGLEDRWEIQWFGGLEKNGQHDTDGDGLTDGGEYLAGTVPVDDESIFRLSIGSDPEGTVLIQWRTMPGRDYRVREREGLDGEWVEWPEVYRGDGTVLRVPGKPRTNGPRFYQLSVSAAKP